MHAVRVAEYGGPEVLVPVESPDPVAGTGEVVVRAEAIDTIYLETQIRGGWGEAFGVAPPYVPGGAAAGTVVSVGPEVDPSWVGRRVLPGPGPVAPTPSSSAPVSTGWYPSRMVSTWRRLPRWPTTV